MKFLTNKCIKVAVLGLGIVAVAACNRKLDGLEMYSDNPAQCKVLTDNLFESAMSGDLVRLKQILQTDLFDNLSILTATHLANEFHRDQIKGHLANYVRVFAGNLSTFFECNCKCHICPRCGSRHVPYDTLCMPFCCNYSKINFKCPGCYVCSLGSTYAAADKGSLTLVKYFIENRHSIINQIFIDGNSRTSLHAACFNGDLRIVKYLIETGEAQMDLIDVFGKMPIDLAAENNHKDVVEYLLSKSPLLLIKSPSQKLKLEKQVNDLVNNEEVQNLLSKYLGRIGIDANSINKQDFSKFILNYVEKVLKGEAPKSDPLLENDPAIKPKVDECLGSMAKELQIQAAKNTGAVKDMLINFNVESLRPEVSRLVNACNKIEAQRELKKKLKALDEKYNDFCAQEDDKYKKDIEDLDNATKELIDKKEEEKKEDKEQDPYKYPKEITERRFVRSERHLFAPNFRLRHYKIIQNKIRHLNESLVDSMFIVDKKDILPFKDTFLATDIKSDVFEIMTRIDKLKDDLKFVYNDVKAMAKVADMSVLSALSAFAFDTKNLSESNKEIIDRRKAEILDTTGNVIIAKYLFLSLKSAKQSLQDILVDYGEPLYKYNLDKCYESDEENDYSNAQLNEYLSKMLPKEFMQSLPVGKFSNLDLSVIKKLGKRESVPITDIAVLLARMDFAMRLEVILNNTKAVNERIAISKIKKILPPRKLSAIIGKLGSREHSSINDFSKLMPKHHRLAVSIASMPHIAEIKDNNFKTDYVSDIMLKAIVSGTNKPFGKTFKTTEFNVIKKNFFKLKIANKALVRTVLDNNWPLYLK